MLTLIYPVTKTFRPSQQLGPTLLAFSGRIGTHLLEGPKRLEVQRRFGPKLFFYGDKVQIEKPFRISLREVFTIVALLGCLFHNSQTIFQRVQETGLTLEYKEVT